jgi:uncharacterized surface anchored protein
MAAWLFLSILLQTPGTGQECSISGRVYSLSTGAPLKKAQLRLGGQGVNSRLTETATATDGEGNFSFNHLAPGKYSVSAERNGYLMSSTPLLACPSSDVTIKLQVQGLIYGKVLDDDGEPIGRGATVSVFRRAWIHGQRRLQVTQGTIAQADGSFVMGNLATGIYYLSAKTLGRALKGEAPVENFYPDTPDAQAATPVRVLAGAEVRGINLRVRTARAYSIRGKAFNASGEPLTGIPLMLVSINGSMSNAGTTAGRFEFQNVLPGNYVIQAAPYGERNSVNRLTAHVPVTVGDEDVADVRVTLGPGAEIPGLVKLNDAPAKQAFQVTLEPLNGGGLEDVANVKDGAFELRSVAPTVYHIAITNLPDGFCVKSMRFAERDVVHRELDLSSGAGGALEIQLSAKPAAITGTVHNSNGDPVTSANVQVWSKDDPEVRPALTDDAGHFTLHNLPPGEYRVIAFESIERGVIENPTFRASFEGQAAVVTLQEGSQENVDLKLIPKAAVETEVAKLP